MNSQVNIVSKGCCEVKVYPDDSLNFHVRVSMAGRSFVQGGFRNPDEAQRHGIAIMLTMDGLQRR